MKAAMDTGFVPIDLEKHRNHEAACQAPQLKVHKSVRSKCKSMRLFREYRKTGDPEVRNQICQSYLNLTSICAWKYSGRGVDYEDLRQEGCLGLMRAIDRFDPDRGVEFTTYATYFVEGHIRQYFRDKAWPCYAPRSAKVMSTRIQQLSNELGRTPARREVVELCEIPDGKADEAIAAAQIWNAVNFYQDDSSTGLNPAIANEISYVDENLDRSITKIDVRNAVEKTLNETEFSIVKMYYEDEMSQREIARKLGTYQMMVSRSLQKSAGKLGAALSEEKRAS